MNKDLLPHGTAPEAVKLPHFPARFQAVIFRNWGMVPVRNIACALDSTEDEVLFHAEKMGLDVPVEVSDLWLKRGYVSIIRINWHLLNYDGILKLLEITEEKLSDIIQNEDFLWIKLGSLKPSCPPVKCRELTPDEEKQTAKIKAIVQKYRPQYPVEDPFAFIQKFSAPADAKADPDNKNLYIAYSYSALYGDSLANPELDPYPDSLLKSLAAKGINAIWLPAILYQLHYWEDVPELSENYEKRLETLNSIVDKAEKYNMKVFLYLNEPRGLPIGQFRNNTAVREKYLQFESSWQNLFSMCTAKKAVLEYLENAVTSLFKAVPKLGGAFMITQSEYLTHCNSVRPREGEKLCPVCSKRKTSEIISEIVNTIIKSAKKGNPNAQIICWDWAWQPEWIEEIAQTLPAGTAFMSVSESLVPVEKDGIKTAVSDYSLSHHGPGEKAKNTWRIAAENNLKSFAKMQISCSWEGSSVPYIPVTKLVEEHVAELKKIGINNFVTNWTLGGYPSINMDLFQISHDEMVIKNFGIKALKSVSCALEKFSEAFRYFPFDVQVLYYSPHNIGAANLLYEKPTNYASSMVGIPYDDLKKWCGPYTPEIYCKYFGLLCEKWAEGIQILQLAKKDITCEYKDNYDDLMSVAKACLYNYSSAVNQAFFVKDFRGKKHKKELDFLLDSEIFFAAEMLKLARQDSRLGFEATNHYAFTCNELLEKIINCEYLKSKNQ